MKRVLIINKRVAIVACILTISLIVSIFIFESPLKHIMYLRSEKVLETNTYNPPDNVLEETYRDMVITLLYPYISNAIEDYYGQPFNHDPWSDIILSVERQGASQFSIKLEVMPYYGPHNSVGVDHITISIEPSKVKIEKFEHIKTYSIPQKPKTP